MNHIKPGVGNSIPPTLELLDAVITAAIVYTQHGVDFTVTELSGGTHLPNSLHYTGKAVDCRTRHLSPLQLSEIAQAIQQRLGCSYDVLVEPDHLHIEYDPAH